MIDKNLNNQKNQESEQLFFTLFNASPTAIVLSDLNNGRFVEFNQEFLILTGYSRDELIGLTSFEAGIVSDPESREKTLRNLQNNEKVKPFEVIIKHKSGKIRYGVVTLEVIEIKSQKYALSNFMDITDRKAAENKVIQLKRLYKTLSQINQAIVRNNELEELYQHICDISVTSGEFSLAWIGVIDQESGVLYSEYPSYSKSLLISQEEIHAIAKIKSSLIDLAISEAKVKICNNLTMTASYNSVLMKGLSSQAIVPFELCGKVMGFLSLYTCEKEFFDDKEVQLLEEISLDISYALDQMRIDRERKKTEAQLEESEENYRLLSESADDWVYWMTPENCMRYVSPSCKSMTGYDIEAFKADPELVLKITHPDDREMLQSHRGNLRKPNCENFEYRIITKTGEEKWINHSCAPIIGDNGDFLGRRVANRNITDKKLMELEVRDSDARLKTIFQVSPDAVLIFEVDGKIIDANPASIELSGYSRDELLEMCFWDLSPSKNAFFTDALMENIIKIETLEWQLKSKNGNITPIEIIFKPFMMDGAPQIFTSARDITNRIESEKKINLQLKRLRGLRTIDLMITSNIDLYSTMEVILDETMIQLNVDAAAILLFDENTRTLEYIAKSGFRSIPDKIRAIRLGDDFASQVIAEKSTVHIANIPDSHIDIGEKLRLVNESFIEYYGVPLISNGLTIGVMEIYNRSQINNEADWQEYLETLAGQVAIAAIDAKLFEDVRRSNSELKIAYDATIEGWSRAMDLRDKDTEGHSLRVTDMTIKLAIAAEMKKEQISHMRRGALLHDIGKLGIPDSILLKPGKLSTEEWSIMRMHPQFAYEMLSPIDYLKPALEIPYCHHEKWDGSGYPQGLKGEDIPLSARLFAIVDVWDALHSDRPYRLGWADKDVLAYIKKETGTHFDPKAVELFFQVFGDRLFSGAK
ncbi:MAG: PAS domain S-box protein [Acetobacterium woodii]|nr:PAS domain S-box protein [Acetobacterium woodii]